MTSEPPSTSPLGAIVSLLPFLLSSSSSALPDSILSTNVLLRHKYLEPSPSSSSYLQATSSAIAAAEVERRREALSTRWLEDVRLSDVEYSGQTHEDGRLVAKVTLAEDDEDAALDLLVVWEEATPSSTPKAKQQADSPSTSRMPRNSAGHAYTDEGYDTQRSSDDAPLEDDESAWRYYDIQLPNELARGWFSDPTDAIRARDCLEAARGMTGIVPQRSRASSNGSGSAAVERSKLLRESRHSRDRGLSVARPMHIEPPEQGLQGEEGAEQDANDYWAGCESDQEDSYRPQHTARLDENAEDDYWASYDQQETTIPDREEDHTAASDEASSRGDEMFGEQTPFERPQDKTLTGSFVNDGESDLQHHVSTSDQHTTTLVASPATAADAAAQRAIRAMFDMYSASQAAGADEQDIKARFMSICQTALEGQT